MNILLSETEGNNSSFSYRRKWMSWNNRSFFVDLPPVTLASVHPLLTDTDIWELTCKLSCKCSDHIWECSNMLGTESRNMPPLYQRHDPWESTLVASLAPTRADRATNLSLALILDAGQKERRERNYGCHPRCETLEITGLVETIRKSAVCLYSV